MSRDVASSCDSTRDHYYYVPSPSQSRSGAASRRMSEEQVPGESIRGPTRAQQDSQPHELEVVRAPSAMLVAAAPVPGTDPMNTWPPLSPSSGHRSTVLESRSRQTTGETTATGHAQAESLHSQRHDLLQCDGIPDLTDSVRITERILGEGSFSDVHEGFLDGSAVAVKRFNARACRQIENKCSEGKASMTEWSRMSMLSFPFIVQFLGLIRGSKSSTSTSSLGGGGHAATRGDTSRFSSATARSQSDPSGSIRHEPEATATHIPDIVMEKLASSLEKRFKATPALRWDEHVQIARQISSALRFLHRNKVSHRDMRPANVMLSAEPPGAACNCAGNGHLCLNGWVAKLTDFGCCRLMPEGAVSAEMTANERCSIYTAPEVMKRTASCSDGARAMYGTQADIYGFGASMLAMCTGRDPAQQPNWKDRFLEELENIDPHPLKPIICTCVQYEQEERCTALQLTDRLDEQQFPDQVFMQGTRDLESSLDTLTQEDGVRAAAAISGQMAEVHEGRVFYDHRSGGVHSNGARDRYLEMQLRQRTQPVEEESRPDVNDRLINVVGVLEQRIEELERQKLRENDRLQAAAERLMKPFLKAQVSIVGKLPPQVSLASGTPCIHHGYIYRSARWRGADGKRTVLLRAPVGSTSAEIWEHVPLPELPSGVWARRVHTHSFGNYLYCIVTKFMDRLGKSSLRESETPLPEIWSLDTQCRPTARWQFITRFSRERYHFGSVLIQKWIVVAGGHGYDGQSTPSRHMADSIECIELTCGDGQAREWFALPKLPTTMKLGRLVEYNGDLCIIGYDRPHHLKCTRVFTFPMATIQQLSDSHAPLLAQAPTVITIASTGAYSDADSKQSSTMSTQEPSIPEYLDGSPVVNPQDLAHALSELGDGDDRQEDEEEESFPAGPDWNTTKIAPVPNRTCCPVVINGALVIAGGKTLEGEIVGDIMVHDVVNNIWVCVASLQQPCYFARLLPVNDGILCICGSVPGPGDRWICKHNIEHISFG